MKNKVIVLVLGYNSLGYLEECLSSVLNQDYKNFEVWFADNASFDGSVDFVSKKFPKIKAIQFKKNTGYAGGNNELIKKAFLAGADFCLLLNPDTKSSETLISDLVDTYCVESKSDNNVGLIQPLVMLYDNPDKINSAGNVIHYLGFGYCGEYMSDKIPKRDKEIISVSGTAMLISKKYYEDIGLFDENFFMYNEDQDYSWRGLIMGYKHFLSVKGTVWHKYSFSKNKDKWYQSEKNRLMMIYKNYEKRTLIKLLPIIIFNEAAVMVYSILNGWIGAKIKSYIFFFRNFDSINSKRKKIQKMRKVSDKCFFREFNSVLDFVLVNNFWTKKIVYFFYRNYYLLVCRLI